MFAHVLALCFILKLILFFEKHHVLYPHQYDFRSNHSTIHALLYIISTLYDSLNNKILSCLVMIDLKKAFDTYCLALTTSPKIRTLWR